MREPFAGYPADLTVDYPERLDRLSTLLRLILVIPIAIVLASLSGSGRGGDQGGGVYLSGPGILFIPVLLMLVFRQKYPRWWFDWNTALVSFGSRVAAYVLLLRDEYPSTDEAQAVHVAIRYPDARVELNRWLPLVKWLLAIPHYVVLFFLNIAVVIAWIIAWFTILFTGSYPRGLFDFVVGVMRYALRVGAYVALLTTDRYPPFSLAE